MAPKIYGNVRPEDDYTHPLGPEENFNESVYFNFFDRAQQRGGFLRIGNRANEGYAEMTVIVYQPDGSALVSLPDRLVMQEMPPEPGLAPLQVIPGLWLPRGRDTSGVILLGPRETSCQVSRLRMGATAK